MVTRTISFCAWFDEYEFSASQASTSCLRPWETLRTWSDYAEVACRIFLSPGFLLWRTLGRSAHWTSFRLWTRRRKYHVLDSAAVYKSQTSRFTVGLRQCMCSLLFKASDFQILALTFWQYMFHSWLDANCDVCRTHLPCSEWVDQSCQCFHSCDGTSRTGSAAAVKIPLRWCNSIVAEVGPVLNDTFACAEILATTF